MEAVVVADASSVLRAISTPVLGFAAPGTSASTVPARRRQLGFSRSAWWHVGAQLVSSLADAGLSLSADVAADL